MHARGEGEERKGKDRVVKGTNPDELINHVIVTAIYSFINLRMLRCNKSRAMEGGIGWRPG